MDKKKTKNKNHNKKKYTASNQLAKFRGWIQAGATLLTNIHLPNFFKGEIYQGKGKAVCVPGLNCYSCPAASGACPIGSFQAVVGSSKYKFSYYKQDFSFCWEFCSDALSADFCVRLVGYRICCTKSRPKSFQQKNSSH